MKLNKTVQCDGYEWQGKDAVLFTLSGCTVREATALEEPYIVYEDDGETAVADFTGLELTGAGTFGRSSVQLRASRELSTDAREAIHAVEQNVAALSGTVDTVSAKADTAQTAAEQAQTAAETAQAAANPQVVTFARMAVPGMAAEMTVSEGASVSTLWPEKRVGDTVKLKDFFWYGGELYRCNQPDLTITEGQTPDMNLPALYGHVSVAPDGLLIWDADDLTGAPDIYNTGTRVHYPDADGPVYVSGRDGNTSTPGTDQWWTLEAE